MKEQKAPGGEDQEGKVVKQFEHALANASVSESYDFKAIEQYIDCHEQL